jgi:hypothetical protein
MPRLSAALSSDGPPPGKTRKGILESHPLRHGATAETAASPRPKASIPPRTLAYLVFASYYL